MSAYLLGFVFSLAFFVASSERAKDTWGGAFGILLAAAFWPVTAGFILGSAARELWDARKERR